MVNEELVEPGLPNVAEFDAADLPPDEGDSGHSDEIVVSGGGGVVESTASLTPQQRASAQHVVLVGANLMLANPGAVHYTQQVPQRWEGINDKRYVRDGRIPTYGDCSSTATWLLWNALFAHLGMGDVVNGQNWRAGYTGTMLQHGHVVTAASADVGDLVIYGSGPPGEHVTVYIGGGYVFSHGSEPGPYKLALRYRSDVLSVRRYF